MSTPEQARRGERALAARDLPAAEPGPTLGERLLAAREQKGVDLYRAERDTKIRAKYLAALEHGDFSELPGSVYTKGFLRNYALYLGLDPDAVLEQYRGEYGASRASEPVVIVPPALEAPRGGLTFTPGLVVAAVLTNLWCARVLREHGHALGTPGPIPSGSDGIYFELRVDAHPVDPLQWLRKK